MVKSRLYYWIAKLEISKISWDRLLPYVLSVGLLSLAISTWLIAIPKINLNNITDIGLVTALPAEFFIAFGLLAMSFSISLRYLPESSYPLLNVLLLIIMIYGSPALVYEVPRFAWTYKHIGVTDYILTHGRLNPSLSIYHEWPGFFALAALFQDLAGLQSLLDYVIWSQLFFNILYIAALWFCFTSVTDDIRLVWLGIWLFELNNWVGQDYFAPQSFGFFLYLMIIGICLRWFQAQYRFKKWMDRPSILSKKYLGTSFTAWHQESIRVPNNSPRIYLKLLLLFLFVTVIYSHQLTPIVIAICVFSLVLFKYCSERTLPIFMIFVILVWILFATPVAAESLLPRFIHSLGDYWQNLFMVLSDDSISSPGHKIVAYGTRTQTLILWLFAFWGAIRFLREVRFLWPFVILSLSILPLVFIRYGDETILRVYLFTLPFISFLASGPLVRYQGLGQSRISLLGCIGLSCLFLGGYVITGYGNERITHISQNDVEAIQYLYQIASPGSRLISVNTNVPWKFKREGDIIYSTPLEAWYDLDKMKFSEQEIESIAKILSNENYTENYLLITKSQYDYSELYGKSPAGGMKIFEDAIQRSDRFLCIYSNSDARIYIPLK